MKQVEKITNAKTFLIAWFNGLMLRDSCWYNSLAWLILGNLVVIFWALWHIVNGALKV